jgi:DNA replication protein DnaC
MRKPCVTTYKTPTQIYIFGADGGGKNILVTASFIKININSILSIYRFI